MNKLRIVVVEDEALIREGICSIINSQNDMWTVVGTANNGQEGLELITTLKPDIILTDIKMPYIDGLELAGIIRERDSDTIIIIISGYADFSYAQQALKYNVLDFILKPSSAGEIVGVIQKAQSIREKQEQNRRIIENNSTNLEFMTNLLQNLIYSQAMTDDAVEGNREKAIGKIKEQIEKTGFWSLHAYVAEKILSDMFQGILSRMLNDKIITQEEYNGEKKASETLGGQPGDLNLLFEGYLNRLTTLYLGSKNDNKLAIRKAAAFIRENYSREITLKVVADMVFLNYYYFSQLFKRETGMSFTEYLTQVRMEKAKELLKEVKYKTYEISHMLGYSSSKHFSAIFKKSFGLTPIEYRNKHNI
jgi:two-component system, response regulator YesN